jgi:hypothetical protein
MPAGAFELILGVALLLPSARFLIWIITDPNAGPLMIRGALMATGAVRGGDADSDPLRP